MMPTLPCRSRWSLAALLAILLIPLPAAAQSARTRYETALDREQKVRQLIESTSPGASSANRARVFNQARAVVTAYHAIARRYPRSGYTDNALWQAASLLEALWDRYEREDDREEAIDYYRRVIAEYPSSSLVRKTRGLVSALEKAGRAAKAAAAEAAARKAAAEEAAAARKAAAREAAATKAAATASSEDRPLATLTNIERVVLPDAVRVTVELDREVPYYEERIEGPDRVFFDLRGVDVTPALVDASLAYETGVVREIRVGRHPDDTVRVVLDIEDVDHYSVFTLYNPFRLVIDAARPTAARARRADALEASASVPAVPEPLPAEGPELADPPAPPSANSQGGFSLSRQLGLGVSRIVIDPGHGGRDPGSRVKGLNEADVVLDVALRLEKLLKNERGIEVIMTRRTNVYIPLEERTAIANREQADLFLSVHVNASRNRSADGVETYYLSFASSPEAEAVAARENSASEREMHNLPDIIKAIALNSKLDESHELATMVQESLVSRLKGANRNLTNRGVKKAPFVVLIGAVMPSVLAEISFITNKDDARLLKTDAYKQRVAEALHQAVLRYRQALKRRATTAEP